MFAVVTLYRRLYTAHLRLDKLNTHARPVRVRVKEEKGTRGIVAGARFGGRVIKYPPEKSAAMQADKDRYITGSAVHSVGSLSSGSRCFVCKRRPCQ